MQLEKFLSTKPLFYKEIDYNRMPNAWDSVEKFYKLPKIIHIIGTNGKGSTGRFLAHYLYKNGYKVGHYSSPHVLKFNERVWINGKDVSDDKLDTYHKKLLDILPDEYIKSLSYFEYTTLVAMLIFSHEVDFVVLEAGLGGEHDGTSVFGSDLTLVTPIDIDHEDFLGDSIQEIAVTKLRAIRKFAILGEQNFNEVYKISKDFVKKYKYEIFRYKFFFTYAEMGEIKIFVKKMGFASFLVDNFALALAGAKFLGMDFDLSNMEDFSLFGRCQKIEDNITIDVGHNILAAKALQKEFKGREIVLVYNSYKDKDYKQILEILKPIVKKVEILPILNERIAKKENLINALKSLNIDFDDFTGINNCEEYLVFGSFSVIEEFLKYYEKYKGGNR